MNDHNFEQHHKELMEEIKAINKKLDPIFEAYTSWQTLGRWGKVLLYVLGAVAGLIIAFKQIFK